MDSPFTLTPFGRKLPKEHIIWGFRSKAQMERARRRLPKREIRDDLAIRWKKLISALQKNPPTPAEIAWVDRVWNEESSLYLKEEK